MKNISVDTSQPGSAVLVVVVVAVQDVKNN